MEPPVDALLARVLLRSLDELAISVAVLTRDRHVLAINASAASLVRRRDGVRIVRGALQLTRHDDDEALGRLIAHTPHGSEDALIVTDSARSPLHVIVRPLPDDDGNAVLVHLVDLQRQRTTPRGRGGCGSTLRVRGASRADTAPIRCGKNAHASLLLPSHNGRRRKRDEIHRTLHTHSSRVLSRIRIGSAGGATRRRRRIARPQPRVHDDHQ